MTTLQGNGRTIQFSFSNTIHECSRGIFVAELPLLVCSNKKDAEIIQQEVGTIISEVSKRILNDNK